MESKTGKRVCNSSNERRFLLSLHTSVQPKNAQASAPYSSQHKNTKLGQSTSRYFYHVFSSILLRQIGALVHVYISKAPHSTFLQAPKLSYSNRRTWQSCPSGSWAQNLGELKLFWLTGLNAVSSEMFILFLNSHGFQIQLRKHLTSSFEAKRRMLSSGTGTIMSPNRKCKDESTMLSGRPPARGQNDPTRSSINAWRNMKSLLTFNREIVSKLSIFDLQHFN